MLTRKMNISLLVGVLVYLFLLTLMFLMSWLPHDVFEGAMPDPHPTVHFLANKTVDVLVYPVTHVGYLLITVAILLLYLLIVKIKKQRD